MKIRYIAVWGLASVIIAFTGCKKNDDKKKMEMPPMTVDVAEVATDSVMVYKDYPGKLIATSVVEVVGRVDGKILTKNFQDGSLVTAGQLLYTIDDTQYKNAVQQAQGQLENARSANDYNSKQSEAMKKALESDAVSKMEVIQAKSNYEEGLASIKTYEANLQTAQTNLSYCRITAPITGRIADTKLMPGAYVSGSAAPVVLTTIYDNSTFYAEFAVEESTFMQITGENSSKLKPGYGTMPLNFSEPLKHEYVGNFSYVAPDVNTGTGTMLIRAEIKNNYDELRDGMYVTVSLPFQNDPRAIVIEDEAIGTDQQGKYVYVVNEKNEVVYTPIKIGSLAHDNMRIVTEGLKPGQKYVTKALLKVQNGVKVNPVMRK